MEVSHHDQRAERLTRPRPLHRRFRPVETGVRTAIPFGLLGMLVLIVGVEIRVVKAGLRFQDHIGFSWTFSARAATEHAADREILFFGDSLTKLGINPHVIEQVTGRSSYNLAGAANPISVTYSIFRRALAAGARPKAIVFDMKPSVLIGGPEFNVRYFPNALGLLDLLELCRVDHSPRFAAELMLGALLPSFRSRHEIRDDLTAALRGETATNCEVNSVGARNWTVNHGAHLATPQPGYFGEVTEAHHLQFLSRGFYAHRVNAEYARRMIDLADANGIRTYLLIAPLTPKLQERRATTGADEKYSRFIRTLQDRSKALTVLDARESTYPYSRFIDPIHLDALGSLALSDEVAQVLKHDLDEASPAKRWVRLPAYRERPMPVDLEHLELSRERMKLSARK